MRQIKFRAWFKTKPTWCNQMFYSDEEQSLGDWFSKIQIEQSDAILMQYTGLKDANGKEIYGEDILQQNNTSYKHLVKWYDDSAGFHLTWISDSIRRTGSIITVIGNVHENPELRMIR